MRWLTALALASMVLTACFPRYEPLKSAAKAERQGAEDAEARWAAVIGESLAGPEFALAHRRLCALRGERITAAVAAMEPVGVDLALVRQLRSELQHCAGFTETQARLLAFQEGIALLALAGIEPAQRFEHVYMALPWVRLLSTENVERQRYEEWRRLWVAHLAGLEVGPVSGELLSQLIAEASGGEAVEPVAASLALRVRQGEFSATGDASCVGFQALQSTGDGPGMAVHSAVVLTNCSSSESSRMVDVPYAVEKVRWEEQTRTVTRYQTVVDAVSIPVGTNCYQISDTRQSCHTQYRTEYRESSEPYQDTVTEDVQVVYYETEYRSEERFVRIDKGTLTVVNSSRLGDGARSFSMARTDLKNTANTSPDYDALFEKYRPEVVEQSAVFAKTQLVDDFMNRADLTTLPGVEARLIASEAGKELSAADRDAIAETLGLPRVALNLEPVPLHDIQPLPLDSDPAGRHYIYVDSGVLRQGFPGRLGSIGLGRADGLTELSGHAAPQSYLLTGRVDADIPLVLKTEIGRFGFHVTGHFQGHLGVRSHAAYVLVEEAPSGEPMIRESVFAVGADGSAGLLAGHRNGLFGVFVGARPRSVFSKSGFANMGGASVPLAARLELRPVPRRPIVLSAWGYALDEPDPMSVYGAYLTFPIFRDGFLVAEFTRDAARVQVRGLHQEDYVEAGVHPYQRAWAGFGGGF
jgi:hypothetical protein